MVGLRLGMMSSEGKESSGKEDGSDSGDCEDGSASVIRRMGGNWSEDFGEEWRSCAFHLKFALHGQALLGARIALAMTRRSQKD